LPVRKRKRVSPTRRAIKGSPCTLWRLLLEEEGAHKRRKLYRKKNERKRDSEQATRRIKGSGSAWGWGSEDKGKKKLQSYKSMGSRATSDRGPESKGVSWKKGGRFCGNLSIGGENRTPQKKTHAPGPEVESTAENGQK